MIVMMMFREMRMRALIINKTLDFCRAKPTNKSEIP